MLPHAFNGGSRVDGKTSAFCTNMNGKWKNIQKNTQNADGKIRKRGYFKAENTAKSTNIIYIFEQNDKIFIFA